MKLEVEIHVTLSSPNVHSGKMIEPEKPVPLWVYYSLNKSFPYRKPEGTPTAGEKMLGCQGCGGYDNTFGSRRRPGVSTWTPDEDVDKPDDERVATFILHCPTLSNDGYQSPPKEDLPCKNAKTLEFETASE